MASASEIFRVVGKVVLEGQDAVSKGLTSLGKDAEGLNKTFDKSLGGIEKSVPKNVTKPLDDSLRSTGKEMDNFDKKSDSLTSKLKEGFGLGIGVKVFDTAATAFQKFGSTITDAVFGMNSDLETTELQFTTLMGSAEDAHKQVKFLFDFAKKTPFETGPVIEASRMLQTFGGSALNSEKNLNLVGDAAAATSAPLQEVATWTGRLYAALQAGQPFGEAAARLQELAIMSPKARLEMEKMQKEGKTADEIFAFFQKDMEKFTGAMDRQAGTWQGLKGTISDTINILLAKAGKPFFDIAKQGLGRLTELLGSDEFAAGAEKVAQTISTVLAAAFIYLGDVLKTIQPYIGLIKTGVMDGIAFLQANAVPILNEFSSVLQSVFTTAIPAIMDFVNQVQPAIDSVTSYLTGTVIPAYQSFGSRIIDTFINTIIPAVLSFVATVMPPLEKFGAWFIDEMTPRITKFSSDMIGIFQNTLLPAIQNLIQQIMPALQVFADFFVTSMLPQIKVFATEFMAIWDELEPFIIETLGGLITSIAADLAVIIGFIKDHGDQIMYWINLSWNQVSGVIIAVMEIIKSTIQLAIDIIHGNWSGVWTDIGNIFKGVWDYITALLSPAITIIQDLIGGLLDYVSGVWNSISSLTTSVWNSISATISSVTSAISSVITSVLGVIETIWSTTWNAIQVVADTVWRAIETIVEVQMALVQAVMEPILNAIQSLWETVWGAISDKLEAVWNYLLNNIITPISNTIQTTITTVMNAIQTTMDTILTAIQTSWETVWNAVESTFSTVWNSIQSTATSIWNTISSDATTIWNTIKESITGPVTEAQTTLEGIWNAIQSTAEGIWNTLKTNLGGIASDIATGLKGPFEQFRDSIGGVMDAAKTALLRPLQSAVDGIASFVGAVKDGLNSISSKLGLGDIISNVWSGARITALAKGTENWAGGPALIGEAGTELVRLPDGTLRMVTKAQILNLPPGTTVFDAADTNRIVQNSRASKLDGTKLVSPDTDTARGIERIVGPDALGIGGAFSAIKDVGSKIGSLTGDALDFARGLASKGAGAITSEIMSKAGIPTFPGQLSSMGSAVAGKMKDSVIEGIKELIKLVTDNAPKPDTGGANIGDPGVGSVAGNTILDMAYKTAGQFMLCEKYVGDVMQRLGLRYYRAATALAHMGMQPVAPGTGPAGAVVFYGAQTDPAGHVAFSEGNGNIWGTVSGGSGTGRRSAASFGTPYYTLNPAANGLVAYGPMAVLAGETSGSRPEIVSPVDLMAQTFKGVLQESGAGMNIVIHVTANTETEGYAAGQAAGKGFRDKLIESGFNR
jgi:phage-related protein